jgi:hypothetical protein
MKSATPPPPHFSNIHSNIILPLSIGLLSSLLNSDFLPKFCIIAKKTKNFQCLTPDNSVIFPSHSKPAAVLPLPAIQDKFFHCYLAIGMQKLLKIMQNAVCATIMLNSSRFTTRRAQLLLKIIHIKKHIKSCFQMGSDTNFKLNGILNYDDKFLRF